jgi:PD-(D/E)XK endonuclease
MDTKRLKQIGETFIVSNLLDAGILVAKPFFDYWGTDLIGFASVDHKGKFCRIQCKYRELKKFSSIKINNKNVVGAFLLFIYVKYKGERYLFCLLPEDIHRIFKYNTTTGVYQLIITSKIMLSLISDKSISFTHEKISSIYEVMKSSSSNSELRILFSGFIDKFKKLSEKQRKLGRLKQLIDEFEIKTLEFKQHEKKKELLGRFIGLMESKVPARKE